MGASHREGRRRREFAAAADRPRDPEPRQVRGVPARRAHDLLGSAPTACGIAGSKTGGSSSVASCPESAGHLRRCVAPPELSATYLYLDGQRYWYSTQPTVTQLAEDRAEQLKRNPDKVVEDIEKRLRADLRTTGDFRQIHPAPVGCGRAEDMEARLVVLGIEHQYSGTGRTRLKRQRPRSYKTGATHHASSKTRWCFWRWTRHGSRIWMKPSAAPSPGVSWLNRKS